jgi:2-C-methyl-D-erythritol 2,4-cyclodiphosphate synthase
MKLGDDSFNEPSGTTAFEYCGTIGQDSHRFLTEFEAADQPKRRLVLGGVMIPGEQPLSGNSDADILLHALTNAISGLTGCNILGARTDFLCLDQGITDSSVYLKEALSLLGEWQLCHISISIEGKRPHLAGWIPQIKNSLAELTGLTLKDIGITATSGEGLTAFGRGEGLQAFCQITARRPDQR